MANRVVLVTGGARGIGAGIVMCFVEAGYNVMICDVGLKPESSHWNYELAQMSDVDDILKESPNVRSCFLDVTDNLSCIEAVNSTVDAFGQIDVLVNNAGILDSGAIDSFEEDNWDKIFAVNAKGIFLMSKAALEQLRKSSDASIINTASIAGKTGYPNMSAYCGSKFAAIGITQSLAAELSPEGIRVNAICPGMVGTAMWLEHLLPTNVIGHAQKLKEFEELMQERIPLGRPQSPRDMGEAVIYLTNAKNVTGVALSVSGGFEMG